MSRCVMILPLAMVLGTAPVTGQQTAPVCPAKPAALPIALRGWSAERPVTAAVALNRRAVPGLALARRADVRLAPSHSVTLAAAPDKPQVAGSNAGLVAFRVTRPGTYRIALGGSAWIDVPRAGKPIASTAHDHGPPCSGIRKMVDFALVPDDYILQVSGSKDVVIGVMVTPLP